MGVTMNFDFGEVLSRAWQIFRKNMGTREK